eukprot:9070201-Pyramimonas_sp.AAC.1
MGWRFCLAGGNARAQLGPVGHPRALQDNQPVPGHARAHQQGARSVRPEPLPSAAPPVTPALSPRHPHRAHHRPYRQPRALRVLAHAARNRYRVRRAQGLRAATDNVRARRT